MDLSKYDLSPFIRVDYYNKKIAELEASAKKGNCYAAYELGRRYKEKGNVETAIKYFRKAAELGDSGGLFEIGLYLDSKHEYKKAAKYFQKVIRSNSVKGNDAKCKLGEYYLSDKIGSVFTRRKRGSKLLLSAAREGQPRAQFLCGLVYLKDQESKAELNEIFAWFRCAQLNGDEDANMFLRKFVNDTEYSEQFRKTIMEEANQMIENHDGVYYTLKLCK